MITEEKKPLTLKLLKGLPMAAAGRGAKYMRAIETLCFIKAIWPDEPMPDTMAAREQLADEMKYSERHIRRRIDQLQQFELCARHSLRGLECISWDKLRELFKIPHEHFYHIKNKEHVHLYDIIDAKAHFEKEKQCAIAFRNRVNANPLVRNVVNEVAGRISCGAVAYHQLNFFLSKGKAYNTEDAEMVLSTRYRAKWSDKEEKVLRGDTELSSRALSKLYGLKGHGSIAYKKRKWLSLGLCNIYSRKYEVEPGLYNRGKDRKHRLGYVWFNPAEKHLELIMPDKIEHLPLQSLDHRAERIAQLIAAQRIDTAIENGKNLLSA